MKGSNRTPVTPRSTIHLLAFALFLSAVISGGVLAQEKNTAARKTDLLPAGRPASIARGRILYHDRCEICHFSDSDAKKIGPGLKGAYKRGKFADGGKIDDAAMERWILNGSKNMPPFRPVLNPGQTRDLIDYLKTL